MNFLFLNANTMGRGDDELGEKLLIAFLKNLANSDTQIDMVGCVNSAVLLTTQSGEALAALEILESKGARIASCGTCLEYYDLLNDLKIGSVGNMAGTIEIMASADRVISPC